MRGGVVWLSATTCVGLLTACAAPTKPAQPLETEPASPAAEAPAAPPAPAPSAPRSAYCPGLEGDVVVPDASASGFALVLVIDRSGSMAGPKLDMTKNGAAALLGVLDPSDLLGVIAFDNAAEKTVALQPAKNRAVIERGISALEAGGGTNAGLGLVQAYRELAQANASTRHVLLLSDGQSPYDCVEELVREMKSHDITTSTMGFGDADLVFLEMIAEAGGGRCQSVADANSLPRMFQDEARLAKTAGAQP